MKSKKLISLALVLALAFSLSAGAFAAETDATGNITIEVDGKTVTINTQIYSVVLPTAAAFNFYLDPQGLMSAEYDEDGKINLDELKGGMILGAEPVAFINNSSVPVKLDVSLKATSAASTAAFSDADNSTALESGKAGTTVATFVTSKDAVKDEADNNALLVATPSGADLGTALKEDGAKFAPTAKGFAIGSDAAIKLSFSLPAATYEVTYSGTGDSDKLDPSKYVATVVDHTGSGSALKISGYINEDADWTDFALEGTGFAAKGGESEGASAALASSIGLQVVFTYAKDTDAHEAADYDATGAKFLLDTTLTAIDSPEAAEVPAANVDVTVSSTNNSAANAASVTKALSVIADPGVDIKIDAEALPATITSIVATNFSDLDLSGNITYDATSGILNFSRTLNASVTIVNIKIVAGGVTYYVNVNVA